MNEKPYHADLDFSTFYLAALGFLMKKTLKPKESYIRVNP